MFSREVWLCPMLFVLCKLNCMVHGYRSEDSEFKRFAERKDQARWRTPDGIVEDLSRLGLVVWKRWVNSRNLEAWIRAWPPSIHLRPNCYVELAYRELAIEMKWA